MAATAVTGCTLKRPLVPGGIIPEYAEPTPREQAFGKKLFVELDEDYDLNDGHPEYGQLRKTLNRLLLAIGAEPTQWQLCLFDKADLVDVRAVEGNYIFVWTGFLDFAQNEDEVAAILACEIAHVLANHTEPVEFTLLSRVFFRTAEIATSVGLIVLSQGTVAIGGQGWMEYAYVEASDLDPLDREYNEKEEQEALAIACLILDRAAYNSKALLTFWKRVQEARDTTKREIRLDRSVPLAKRLAMLDGLTPRTHTVERITPPRYSPYDLADLALQDNPLPEATGMPTRHTGHHEILQQVSAPL
jgi:hypothetical protein